ncbi:aminotransferase class V-fold PLP-dependent enzyme [Halomonas aquamarina]|uniref:Aminotransferase class V-fold PLP-dependent enzyme n=1 Tax=Vreelandella aquamarina TaxID=77097 RepID=A0ACC5VRF4_9GAMM|nr:aminotransferase class V-fold PLP-dependent enzyme [Halomonas aquamarina]MBZ5486858.1 aminotransferase class V-fold PLP-dependent enzyme [Halomonas aquamarina]
MSHHASQWNKSRKPPSCHSGTSSDWIRYIRDEVIGEGVIITGPFGERPLLYADYTASGRALGVVEDALRFKVLPFYANTHTETSYTGKTTTRLREAARQAVSQSVGANDDYAVIFTGSGATSAIHRCSQILQLHTGQASSAKARPVVFVGPFEHHSNDLVWRECDVDLVRIPLCSRGTPCLDTLSCQLDAYAERDIKIVAFSAASNVTGIKTDVTALAQLVHQHGGIVLVDYAASGPYVGINMAGTGSGDHLDGIFLSPHKFVGGPGSSGVLVMRKALCRNAKPSVAGGGTVSYVTAHQHRYVTSIQRREEAGTPGILGDIRAGLAFRIKDLVGACAIEAREHELVEMVMARWKAVSNIHLLGSLSASRLAIFSFNISAGGRDIHHNLVVAMLNDLFGIQARGGCSCAGPYGHELLAIDEKAAAEHEDLVQTGRSLYRPGWVRVGFNFFFSNETANYVISAVEFIARYAPILMKLYSVDEHSGVWHARSQDAAPPSADLLDTLLFQETLQEPTVPDQADDYFAKAYALVERAKELPLAENRYVEVPVRWFWWPHEAEQALKAQTEKTQ